MKVKIYDYNSRECEIELPINDANEIRSIYVHVISGDETGWIELNNDEIIDFDASDCRVLGFDDGCYMLETIEEIKKWLEYKPTRRYTESYERQNLFCQEGD